MIKSMFYIFCNHNDVSRIVLLEHMTYIALQKKQENKIYFFNKNVNTND